MGFRTPWHLRVLYISTFILRTAFGALLLLIAKYVPGETDYDLLLNVAIIAIPYPLAEMATANYFGILSDRIGRKPIIVAGTALAAIVVTLYSLSNNIWFLAGMHGIHGIGAAATVAPAIAMIADKADPKDRGRQMGWFDYSTFIGYIVGAVLGGFLIDLTGTRLGFLVVAGFLALSAWLLRKYVISEVPKSAKSHPSGFAELKQVFKNRDVRLMFPIWLIIATLLGLAITYLPRILMSEGLSGTKIGLLFGAAGVALGLLQPFWGKVSDKVGRIPVMAYGVLSIFGLVIVLLVFPDQVYQYPPEGDVEFKIAGIAVLGLLGLGAGAFVPAALAFMADSSDEKYYGGTMGLYSFALGFGALIAEVLGLAVILASGAAQEAEKAPVWLLYVAAALIGLAVAMMIVFFVSSWLGKRLGKHRPESG